MIVESWERALPAAEVDGVRARFRCHLLPSLRRLPGFAGAELRARTLATSVEITLTVRWNRVASRSTPIDNNVVHCLFEEPEGSAEERALLRALRFELLEIYFPPR
jgi:hypothetical protein